MQKDYKLSKEEEGNKAMGEGSSKMGSIPFSIEYSITKNELSGNLKARFFTVI
jgi:hypothetical protein